MHRTCTCFPSRPFRAEAKLGVTLLRGECQTRQFLTATATGAIDATRQIHGRSDTKIKQETKSRGVPSGNEDALCSDTSGGTRASLQERLGMTDDQAKALRVQLTDNKNMRSKPGDQFQLLGKEGNMTEPCWQRLTGEKREGRASLAWYLLEELEVNPARVKSLVVRNPATMLGKSTAAVEQVSRWLSEVMRYDKAQVAQFLVKFPQAGHLSVEANFVPKCRWLCDNLETDYKGVARILKAVPSVSIFFVFFSQFDESFSPPRTNMNMIMNTWGVFVANIKNVRPKFHSVFTSVEV